MTPCCSPAVTCVRPLCTTFHPASAVALEAQAIGRVHRLGQKKPVFVTKFVAKGTVEENVLRWNSDKLGAQAGQAANGGCRSL